MTSRDVNTRAESIINRDDIAQAERLIRPHVRRTPVIEVDAADFGLAAARLSFKLELFQHAGSFKTRGAFTNLLTRNIPRAGVVAASGGNHGAAVAYASLKLGIPAKIFVPTISSFAKIQRIRDYRAELVVTGDRYADALAASEVWAAKSGALSIHAFDQRETLLGQGTIGLEMGGAESRYRHAPRRSWRRRAYRRHRGLVWWKGQGGRRRAGNLPNHDDGARGRRTSRRPGWWDRGGFSLTPLHRYPRVPDRRAPRGPRRPGSGRRNHPGAADPLEDAEGGCRARRCCRVCSTYLGSF
jgi:hypothetical protein